MAKPDDRQTWGTKIVVSEENFKQFQDQPDEMIKFLFDGIAKEFIAEHGKRGEVSPMSGDFEIFVEIHPIKEDEPFRIKKPKPTPKASRGI